VLRTNVQWSERTGTLVYELLLRAPDGSIAESLPIPVEVSINRDGVAARINVDTEWTPSLQGSIPEGENQREHVEKLAGSLVGIAMQAAMAPYRATPDE
jgi:hypothetical protein